MRIIIAGGTGFVGKALVPGLIKDGHNVTILHRPISHNKAPRFDGIKIAFVNPELPIKEADLSADAIINLVGIIREDPSRGATYHLSHFTVTKELVDFAGSNGMKRFLQMSALGVKPNSQTGYFRTKFEAENYVKESGLDWTIFRPAIIFGPGSHFISMLTNMVKRLPAVPVVGDGQYKMQLVHIDDVCNGFRKALLDGRSIGETFEIGGPDSLTYNEILEAIGQVLEKSKVRKFHQPLWMVRKMATLFGHFSWFPFTNDQIIMLLESNHTNDRLFWDMFGLTPKRFEQSLREDF